MIQHYTIIVLVTVTRFSSQYLYLNIKVQYQCHGAIISKRKHEPNIKQRFGFKLMVLNATLNNISVISWL